MKLNLKRIQELEVEYGENPIARNALQTMIDLVMYPQKDPLGWKNETNYYVATNTLVDLGVLQNDQPKKPEQLNS